MQGKGFVTTFAIILGLVCLYYLGNTFYAGNVERKANRIAESQNRPYGEVLDSLAKDPLNLGIVKYNYRKAKKNEINLGLDLKGGINVTLQISIKDLLNELSDDSQNPFYKKALDMTDQSIKDSDESYMKLFFDNFEKVKQENGGSPNLADYDIFGNKNNIGFINIDMKDQEVKKILEENINASINTAFQVYSTRIDRVGVAQPNIQRVPGTGRIMIELPGAKDANRIKKLLQTTARLEFWHAFNNQVPTAYVSQLQATDTTAQNGIVELLNLDKIYPKQANEDPEIDAGGGFGAVLVSDTAKVNKILNSPIAKEKREGSMRNAKFLWASKPSPKNPDYLGIFCIDDVNRNNKPLLDDAVSSATADFNANNQVQVSMSMNTENALKWKDITEKYIGNRIAIVMDNLVYSAPVVNNVISDGRSVITGNFTMQEAEDLADALQSGKLPARAQIVQDEIVGPSLGKASINAGMISFAVAFGCILLWMIFYYGRAGWYADLALIINVFYIIGIFAAFNFVLTLPGIAGLVLTLGIAVDANIITYERVREELRLGKSKKEAYEEGWKHALSAIIDGNVTTLLTSIILFIFGTGPIKGFATTLMIGIICTLFTALLLSRVFIENRMAKDKSMSFWSKITENWFTNVDFKWMSKRKIAYIFSAIITLIAIVSLFTRGLNFGVDFVGGRTYNITYEKPVDVNTLKSTLESNFPEVNGAETTFQVKSIGDGNQVKLTTKYKYNEGSEVDPEIQEMLFKSFQPYMPDGFTIEQFKSGEGLGIDSSSKVGPTIADDIQRKGLIAITLSLIVIFLYILWRFRKWQFSLGAVLALFHDTIFVLGAYSLLWGLLPFSLEIDQSFIAAILTVIGYSINDTVIVFDRIRENLRDKTSMKLKDIVDLSINQTLGRTFNTSFTTLFVVLIIFLFGGENLRGFMFALLIGIGIGTYSSVYIASAIMYDFMKRSDEKELESAKAKKPKVATA